jgi:hypothetical protein
VSRTARIAGGIALIVALAAHVAPAAQNAALEAVDAVVTPEARDAAIRKAFAVLDERAGGMNEGGSPQKQYTLAITAWASLLAGDKAEGAAKLPSRAKELDRLKDYLARYVESVAKEYEKSDAAAAKAKKSGKPAPAEDADDQGLGAAFGRPAQYVWPLSMAAHFFAESYARGKDKGTAKAALKQAIDVLEAAQQPDGGWGHDDATRPGMGLPPIRIPRPGGDDLVYPPSLYAAGNCALSGLGVARAKLGLKGSPAITKAFAHFADWQNGDGSFAYDKSQQRKGSGTEAGGASAIEVARTPGAFFALLCAGAPVSHPAVRAAARSMDAHPEWWSEGHGSATLNLQFAALAAKARGEAAWAQFRRLYFPKIVASQDEYGLCDCIAVAKEAGVTSDTEPIAGLSGMSDWTEQQRLYVTAIHALILLLDRATVQAIPPMPPPAGPTTGGGAKQ